MKSYRPWNPKTTYLVPPSMTDWLPDDHLVYFIIDIVADLDIGPIDAALQGKDRRGTRPYDPRMMVALLLYSYCSGVYSSRRMAKATIEDIAFRILTGDSHPHFTTINEFRRVFREHFSRLFIEALRLCERAGLVKLGHVALDGSKVEANASKHKAMSYKRMKEDEARLRKEIEEMLERADSIDKAEDELYGEGRDAFEWPEEMKTREQRRQRIKEAREALEHEARKERARKLREQADGQEKKAVTEERETIRRRHRSNAKSRRKQAAELFPEPDDQPETSDTDLPKRTVETTRDGLPKDQSQRNFTDPDSHIMVGRNGYIQAYNGQAVVDDMHQVVVAADVTNQPPDNGNLIPMLKQAIENCGRSPEKLSADAGYWSREAPDRAEAAGTDVYVSTKRLRHGQAGAPSRRGLPPDDLTERQKMTWKLDTPDGRAIYARRKAIVEPVFGQIKAAMGFRRFSFRGLRAVQAEWTLICACHNLLKLYRMQSMTMAMS